mmetsp:Transcript_11038/g.32020  ORF Transcript_11038/g.32020 Transcript_11038/m.32020 type:complete len:127 (+) Transcript_11038:80-460(+)
MGVGVYMSVCPCQSAQVAIPSRKHPGIQASRQAGREKCCGRHHPVHHSSTFTHYGHSRVGGRSVVCGSIHPSISLTHSLSMAEMGSTRQRDFVCTTLTAGESLRREGEHRVKRDEQHLLIGHSSDR